MSSPTLYSVSKRDCAIVNLDPANDVPPYEADISLSELTRADDAAKELSLGPNGTLVYCIQYLETNLDWLLQKLKKLKG